VKWRDFLTRFADHPLFHSSSLKVSRESGDYIQVQISRWVRTGKLIQIRRGWYLISEPYRSRFVPPEVIANRVVSPSYLSLEWALSFHGLIPEETPNLTSITTDRAKNFRAVDRFFIYNHVKPTYFRGYSRSKFKNHEIVVATPEKALWDKLYLFLRGHTFSMDWLEELRLQNLEEFALSRWEEYTMMTSSMSIRRASSLVADFIERSRD